MKQRQQRYKIKGQGENCRGCGEIMERREHARKPLKSFYFTEWDCCKNEKCKMTVQHYERYKSPEWVESERQEDFLRKI